MTWGRNRELFPLLLVLKSVGFLGDTGGMEANKNEGVYVAVMGDDCTNGGATSGHRSVFLRVPGSGMTGPGEQSTIPVLELLVDVDPDLNAVAPGRLVVAKAGFVRRLTGAPYGCMGYARVRAVPVGADPRRLRFGGHWVWSSDSRFPFESPVPVFDRIE